MELTTIAKPYVNAIFAISEQNQSHSDWQNMLQAGAQLANNETIQAFIASPSATASNKIDAIEALFVSILGQPLNTYERSFVVLLIDNRRINVLPSMLALFNSMINCSSNDKFFDVVSAYELSAQQQQQLVDDLSKKYNATVSISTFVDENLVGGVVIKEGDKVIDLSVQARIDELGTRLSAN